MIQRIQSVYLVGACMLLTLSALLLYVLPEVVLDGYRLMFAGLLAGLGLASLGAVFLFRQRALQARIVTWLGAVNILIVIAILTVSYFTGDLTRMAAGGSFGVITAVLVVPVVTMVLFFRAGKAIQRDIDLIRSMDRLR